MSLYGRLFFILAALLLNFHFVFAQSNIYDIVNKTADQIINPLIWFALVIATLVFLWGLVQFIMANSSGDEDGIKTGKKHLIWGVIGLFIMLSVRGIIAVIQNFFAGP
jgi:hypothetical protein